MHGHVLMNTTDSREGQIVKVEKQREMMEEKKSFSKKSTRSKKSKGVAEEGEERKWDLSFSIAVLELGKIK